MSSDLFHEHLMTRLRGVVKECMEHEKMLQQPQKLLSFEESSVKLHLSHLRKEINLLATSARRAGAPAPLIEKIINPKV